MSINGDQLLLASVIGSRFMLFCYFLFELGLVSSWISAPCQSHEPMQCIALSLHNTFTSFFFFFNSSQQTSDTVVRIKHFIHKETGALQLVITEKGMEWIIFHLTGSCNNSLIFQNYVGIAFYHWVCPSSDPHKMKILGKHTYSYLSKQMLFVRSGKLKLTRWIWS